MLSRRENRKWPFEGIGLMLRFLATGGPLQLEGRRAWGSDRKPRNSATGSTAANRVRARRATSAKKKTTPLRTKGQYGISPADSSKAASRNSEGFWTARSVLVAVGSSQSIVYERRCMHSCTLHRSTATELTVS